MSMVLFHRTTIAEARSIMKDGFSDTTWDFGLQDARTGEAVRATGVWLAGRPLGKDDGIGGDALLEVQLNLGNPELEEYELEGMLWDTQLWVVPADLVNAHAKTRIMAVDPRSSWWHDAMGGET